MVRALPSDLARLVLDYLCSEGLQNSYDVFLQESPHLEELRSFSSTGILPLGAKNLQVIVEEYYELISQDNSNIKNANDALYKLWRRCDALMVQIKHHYKQSGAITTMQGDIVNQAVRSRYSLNRLHNERLQMEREHGTRFTAIRQQQQQPQQQPQQHHQQQPQQHSQHQQQLRREPHMSAVLQRTQEQQQQQQQQQLELPQFPGGPERGQRPSDARTSTPRRVAPIEETASPQPNVSSTQSQFLTPSKISPPTNDKIVGKSPKRKSAPPRRKLASGIEEKVHSVPSTSVAGVGPPDDISDLPSPWGCVVNNQELVEKFAENINRMLPTQESGAQEAADESMTTSTSSPQQPQHNSDQPPPAGLALDDLLGTMSDTLLEEFVDMTSSDPAFNSLFSLFNTDRDRFLSSERQKMSLSGQSENEEMMSSAESSECPAAHPDSTLPPGENSPPMDAPSSRTPGEVVAADSIRTLSTDEPSSGQRRGEVAGSTMGQWPPGISGRSKKVDLIDQFPNMVVSRTSPLENGSERDEEAVHGPASNSAGPSGTGRVLKVSADSQQPRKGRTSKMIVRSFSEFNHVRTLSFGGTASPPKAPGQLGTPNRTAMSAPRADETGRNSSNGDGKKKDLGELQGSSYVTPTKRPMAQSPSRVYSPKEKVVAQLLTQLPTTPTKLQIPPNLHVIERLSPSALGGRKVYVITRKKTPSKRERDGAAKQSEAHAGRGDGSWRVHVNGARLSDMPGHSAGTLLPGGAKDGRPSVGNRLTGASETHGDKEERTQKSAKAALGNMNGKSPKKGVKRERKATNKTKGSKKSKQSKSKNVMNLAFPDNLDVDKFLSQIHNG